MSDNISPEEQKGVAPVPPEIVKISDEELLNVLEAGQMKNLSNQFDLAAQGVITLYNPNELMFLPQQSRQEMDKLDQAANQAAADAKSVIQGVISEKPAKPSNQEIITQLRADLQAVEANIKRAEAALAQAKKNKDRAKEAQSKTQLRTLNQRKKTLEARL